MSLPECDKNTPNDCLHRAIDEIKDSCRRMELIELSPRQREFLGLARALGEVTSENIARSYPYSVQSISQTLRSMWAKDYLTREEQTQESGGTIFVYRPKHPTFE